jgi:Rieske Fe-S protein
MKFDDVTKNTGKVLKAEHVALYRDQAGRLHAVSSVCTHMGCDVEWNDKDKNWACPCHGSRFAPAGDVVHGPAIKALAAVDIPVDSVQRASTASESGGTR